jgi:hypothetical protein
MKYLLLSFLLGFPTLTSAQEFQTFSNGEVADAEKINDNFSALKNDIADLQSLGPLYTSTFPSTEFELDLSQRRRGSIQTIGLPASPEGFDLAFWGTNNYELPEGSLSANVMGKWRWANENFSDQLHSLCQADRDIGFIPLEASYVISHGANIIALRTSNAAASESLEDTSASVACVKIKPSGEYEFSLYMNYEIVNSHGRFACASVVEPVRFSSVLAQEGKEADMVDLFGINVTATIDGLGFSVTSKQVSENTFFGKINIPASCGSS